MIHSKQQQQQQQQSDKTRENLELWGFHYPARLGEAESDPVITCQRCQIARLRTPRARATEADQDPHLRLPGRVHAGPLRAPQPRAWETARGRPSKTCKCAKKNVLGTYLVQLYRGESVNYLVLLIRR